MSRGIARGRNAGPLFRSLTANINPCPMLNRAFTALWLRSSGLFLDVMSVRAIVSRVGDFFWEGWAIWYINSSRILPSV